MNQTTIRIPTPLRSYTGGNAEVHVEAATVQEALQALGQEHDGILERILAEDGGLRRFVNLYVGSRNIQSLDGLETRLDDDAVIAIVPAVAGGAR